MNEQINNGGHSQQAARVEVPAEFAEYVAKNYSGEVVFSDPQWHAKRLWRAARRSLEAAQPAERQGECEPVAYMTRRGAVYQGKHYDASKGQVPLCPCRCQTHPAAPVGVPEMIVDLAECRKAGWNDGARAYRAGWNACRAEMLELAATPSAREVQA